MVEPPLLPGPAGEHLLEQLPRLLHAHEVVLVGRLPIRVGGRDHHRVDVQVIVQEVQAVPDSFRRVVAEERGVRGNAEPAALGLLDGVDGHVEDALLAHRLVVALPQPVDVHGPGEVRRGLEEVQLLLHQQCVRA